MVHRAADFQSVIEHFANGFGHRAHADASSSSEDPTSPLTAIRAVAVSAPDWISGAKSKVALNSADPASLFNACRYAAYLAKEKLGPWATSNWSVPRAQLRNKFLLMYSLDDMPRFDRVLSEERPNLLFLGAMTLCMPGAVACAQRAKELLGNEVLVVLGGRHVTETIYLRDEKIRASETVQHHAGSPASLVRTGQIPPVFDVIVSGDGEHIISEIGAALAKNIVVDVGAIANILSVEIPGYWIADFPSVNRTIVSRGIPVRYNDMPSIASIFGVSAAFKVFDGRITSHVFSDTGRGCVYDCAFCSERRNVTGGIQDIKGAPSRLHRQLKESAIVIAEDHPGRGASAFVEDSILLSGSPVDIEKFCTLLENDPIDIVFGCQFTIDQILRRRDLILRLAKNGLRYVFIGLETFDPGEIGGMSKDLGGKAASWQSRFLDVLCILTGARISCGCALLFGLGESHASRVALLNQLLNHRKRLRQPIALSANWAVQHPLRNIPESEGETYLRWGTPGGPFLDAFHRFGEASLEYPIWGVAPPILTEVQEILNLINEFEQING